MIQMAIYYDVSIIIWNQLSYVKYVRPHLRGVWDSNRGWIHVESYDDSTWEGRNTTAPLGPPDEWGAQVV